MTAAEPYLNREDLELWEMWQRTAKTHAKTRLFLRRVDVAKVTVEKAAELTKGDLAVMWSGGKDSTAMTHLVRVELELDLKAYSEKDDLDYPGEVEYVETLAKAWALDLEVLRPATSLEQLFSELAASGAVQVGEDIHGRAAALSKEHFYQLVESASAQHDGVLLGLRKEESSGRCASRAAHGRIYRKRSGQLVCTPIADWSGLDVMAYMASRGIEPLPVYRCLALMHAREPWRIRKSWWVPGASSRFGGVAWLRRYYPSLYSKLVGWMPQASRLG